MLNATKMAIHYDDAEIFFVSCSYTLSLGAFAFVFAHIHGMHKYIGSHFNKVVTFNHLMVNHFCKIVQCTPKPFFCETT